jgi:RIO kinase 1
MDPDETKPVQKKKPSPDANGSGDSPSSVEASSEAVKPQKNDDSSSDDFTEEDDLETRQDTDSFVQDSLDLRDSKHDALIKFNEGKVETTFGTSDKESRKTYTEVFNESTLGTIYRLFQRKVLLTVEHAISTGKEANVFLGMTAADEPVAVKIFRESTATFRKVRPYIEGDPRFHNVPRNKRQLVPIWTKKEFKNLMRMEHAGVRVPKTLGIDRNVLVMEYIGDDTMPAPLLRSWWHDHRHEDGAQELLQGIFDDLCIQMRLIHQEAGLVHADLSEFNILIHEGLPYIIDVGQAVVLSHPMSREFLDRDLRNIAAYFQKMGIETDENSLRTFIFDIGETDDGNEYDEEEDEYDDDDEEDSGDEGEEDSVDAGEEYDGDAGEEYDGDEDEEDSGDGREEVGIKNT